jgi:hypothetical protein
MNPKQKVSHAYELVRGLVQSSNTMAGDIVPTPVAMRYIQPAASRQDILLVAQALGWIQIILDSRQQVTSVKLTQAGFDAGLADPEYQPEGIGVFRDDDGYIIAVLVRHPDGTLEIVALDDYSYDPPVDELPDVPMPEGLKNEHRPRPGL